MVARTPPEIADDGRIKIRRKPKFAAKSRVPKAYRNLPWDDTPRCRSAKAIADTALTYSCATEDQRQIMIYRDALAELDNVARRTKTELLDAILEKLDGRLLADVPNPSERDLGEKAMHGTIKRLIERMRNAPAV